jgi:hypothetical protein
VSSRASAHPTTPTEEESAGEDANDEAAGDPCCLLLRGPLYGEDCGVVGVEVRRWPLGFSYAAVLDEEWLV